MRHTGLCGVLQGVLKAGAKDTALISPSLLHAHAQWLSWHAKLAASGLKNALKVIVGIQKHH